MDINQDGNQVYQSQLQERFDLEVEFQLLQWNLLYLFEEVLVFCEVEVFLLPLFFRVKVNRICEDL